MSFLLAHYSAIVCFGMLFGIASCHAKPKVFYWNWGTKFAKFLQVFLAHDTQTPSRSMKKMASFLSKIIGFGRRCGIKIRSLSCQEL